jgi:hypothetical protein
VTIVSVDCLTGLHNRFSNSSSVDTLRGLLRIGSSLTPTLRGLLRATQLLLLLFSSGVKALRGLLSRDSRWAGGTIRPAALLGLPNKSAAAHGRERPGLPTATLAGLPYKSTARGARAGLPTATLAGLPNRSVARGRGPAAILAGLKSMSCMACCVNCAGLLQHCSLAGLG